MACPHTIYCKVFEYEMTENAQYGFHIALQQGATICVNIYVNRHVLVRKVYSDWFPNLIELGWFQWLFPSYKFWVGGGGHGPTKKVKDFVRETTIVPFKRNANTGPRCNATFACWYHCIMQLPVLSGQAPVTPCLMLCVKLLAVQRTTENCIFIHHFDPPPPPLILKEDLSYKCPGNILIIYQGIRRKFSLEV